MNVVIRGESGSINQSSHASRVKDAWFTSESDSLELPSAFVYNLPTISHHGKQIASYGGIALYRLITSLCCGSPMIIDGSCILFTSGVVQDVACFMVQ